ncbi:MAG TPA: hypothetical protein VF590_09880, partial [Isosphaeraceae bacterium]
MAATRVPLLASPARRIGCLVVAGWIVGMPRAGDAHSIEGLPESNSPRAYADVSGWTDPGGPSFGETDWVRRWADASGGRGAEGSGGGDSGGPSTANSGANDLPDPFRPFFEAINLAQLHRRLDEALGFDAGTFASKPEVPEIPLAVFVEVIRPLGALKYENQTNYFVGAFTGSAPTLQALTYEYVFADWHSARVELTYPNGRLEALVPGYQRTLGVGPRGNWIHGFQIFTEIFLRRDVVGGRAFYIFGWKPEKESPWSTVLSLGADRASIEGAAEQVGPMTRRPGLGEAGDEGSGSVWRPFVSANAFYAFGPSLSVGIENDVFPSSRLGEYLFLPNLTWRPTQHVFAQ